MSEQTADDVAALVTVLRAAEVLADAAEDTLYIEGDHREALVAAWRSFCGAADSCTHPLMKQAQSEYWAERDRPALNDG